MIPKLIHFIWWQGADQLPPKYQKNVRGWIELNPSYKVIIWNESMIFDLCKSEFPQYENDLRQSKHFVENVDLAKLMIMESIGGFYVDTDINPRKPLPEEWRKYKAIFTELNLTGICDKGKFCMTSMLLSLGQSYYQIFNNGFYGGVPKTLIFSKMLDKCIENRHSIPRLVGHFTFTSYTAGPMFLTIYIKKHLRNDKDILFLPQQVFEGCGMDYNFTHDEADCEIDESTVGVHFHGLSWVHPVYIYIAKCSYSNHIKFKIIRWIIFLLFIYLLWLFVKRIYFK